MLNEKEALESSLHALSSRTGTPSKAGNAKTHDIQPNITSSSTTTVSDSEQEMGSDDQQTIKEGNNQLHQLEENHG